MSLWTNASIQDIFLQLEERNLPFRGIKFAMEQNRLVCLGQGGSGRVYEVTSQRITSKRLALKVIGFEGQYVDRDIFAKAVEIQQNNTIGWTGDTVKIHRHKELWITLDEKNQIRKVETKQPDEERYCLHLFFILMEKVDCVIHKSIYGKIQLTPGALEVCDEKEVWKVAYDIGTALERLHEQGVLHRDIKLENIFYHRGSKKYQLGDFGLAIKTRDGFAAKDGMTKGYAAPEVVISKERYDATADIYSYGMMLYILMNQLHFPESNSYAYREVKQYAPGYELPRPKGDISEEFWTLIRKACQYDPDRRYQTMHELMEDLEKIVYGNQAGEQKRGEYAYCALAAFGSAILGMGWKLLFAPSLAMDFSIWQYLFWGSVLILGHTRLKEERHEKLTLVVLVIGGIVCWDSGITIQRGILILLVVIGDIFTGMLGAGVLCANMIWCIQKAGQLRIGQYTSFRWVTMLAVLLTCYCIHCYYNARAGRRQERFFHQKGKGMVTGLLASLLLCFCGVNYKGIFIHYVAPFFRQLHLDVYSQHDYYMTGSAGLLLFGGLLVSQWFIIRGRREMK
ncbi:Serine/threonine protein kinase [Lachnospiraceae bacterium C10]|nr:Serine/threonine protein kinase [Lachnospiraceae bacterium C10]